MAATLAASLTAHQKLPSGRKPVLSVTASAKRHQVDTLRWTRYYTGAEAAGASAVVVANDGALIRARIDGSGNVLVSRVTSPGSGSTYSSWTDIDGGLTATNTGNCSIGMAINPTSNEIALCYTRNSRQGTYVVLSSDGGATWGTPTIRISTASSGWGSAIAYNPSGNIAVFHVTSTNTILRVRRTAGVWEGTAGTVWTNTAYALSIAAAHDGADYGLIVAGRVTNSTGEPRLWSCSFGDGGLYSSGTWSALTVIAEEDITTGTSTVPYVVSSGAAIVNGYPQVAYTHVDMVAVPGGYEGRVTRPAYSGGFDGALWDWGSPVEPASVYGVALCWRSNAAWMITPDGVWYATTGGSDDLSSRVLSCRYRVGTDSSKLTLELDNHDGALNGAPNGTYDGLMLGGTLTVLPGYYSGTAGAAEYGVTVDFTVERITYRHRNDGSLVAIVEGVGPWEVAARSEVVQVYQFAAAAVTRSGLFQRFAARAGFRVVNQGSPRAPSTDFTATSPAFAVAPGQSNADVLRALLAATSDYVRPDRAEFRVVGTLAADASDVTYGGSGNHPIAALDLLDAPQEANWVRLSGPTSGATFFADDAYSYDSVYKHGPRLRQQRVNDATSGALATSYAAAAARRDVVDREYGTLTVPFDAARQVLDVVTVNDTSLGVSAVKYRVLALEMNYARGPKSARYDLTLTLGGM
ncbi:MAG: hypothetical protein HY875_17200 [Chloroflexi bacterium]|nr:hypothetical protein [Chloroflexota bacterium]